MWTRGAHTYTPLDTPLGLMRFAVLGQGRFYVQSAPQIITERVQLACTVARALIYRLSTPSRRTVCAGWWTRPRVGGPSFEIAARGAAHRSGAAVGALACEPLQLWPAERASALLMRMIILISKRGASA